MATGEEIIRLEDVGAVYEGERTPAIREIDLSVSSGDFICVIGPNGAGKTTLLEVINGILSYTSGNGMVFGLSIPDDGHLIRRRIGYVIQNFEIDPLSPFLCKNVVMSGRVGRIGLLRFPTASDWDIVARSMSMFGMRSYADRPVGKLSGGEFQKILLARAVAQEPDIYLLDEPFSNLDVKAREEVHRIVTELNKKGSTVLMVSHDVSSIPKECTRVLLMDRGRIASDCPRDEVVHSGAITELLCSQGACL